MTTWNGVQVQEEQRVYRALIGAILLQAIRDHQKAMRNSGHGATQSEPGRWILSDDDAPLTYLWCCNVLGLSPDGLRARMYEHGILRQLRQAA